jgi:hypothetical protein
MAATAARMKFRLLICMFFLLWWGKSSYGIVCVAFVFISLRDYRAGQPETYLLLNRGGNHTSVGHMLSFSSTDRFGVQLAKADS